MNIVRYLVMTTHLTTLKRDDPMKKTKSESDLSPLKKLVIILTKFNIFPNQIIFYNCVFNLDTIDSENNSAIKSYYSDYLMDNIRQSLAYANTKNIPIIDKTSCCNENSFIYKFLQYATGDFSKRYNIDPSCPFSGTSVNSSAGNISKIINHKREIEPKWVKRFGPDKDRTQARRYFCEPLSLIMQYLILLDSKADSTVEKKDISMIMNSSVYESYYDFYVLKEDIQRKLIDTIKVAGLYPSDMSNDITSLDFRDIARIIYITIQKQCPKLDNKNLINKTINKDNKPHSRSLKSDYEFYVNNVNCYGYKTSDRFNMLKKYADSNVYCANELGAIYYYGDKFYSVHDEFIIEQDYRLAETYYYFCSKEPMVINNACWSLGYMVLHDKCPMINAANRNKYEYAANLFKKCDSDYPPALNSLGLIELHYGNELRNCRCLEEIDSNTLKKILTHYNNFINYSYKAAKKGLTNGYNAIAGFLLREENTAFIPLIKSIKLNKIELLPMLEASADMNNVWALDQLANIYYRMGVEENEIIQLHKAKELLENAHNQGYSWSTYHLAIYFYRDNVEKYKEYISIAAQKGCVDAIKCLEQEE